MRSLTARQKAALSDPAVHLVNMVEMGHPNGTLYLHSGVGVIDYGGQEWQGCGLFGIITGLEQGSDPRINNVGFAVGGVPGDVLDVSDRDLKGYQSTIYQALLTPDGRVIDGLITVDVVDLDYQETTADEEGTFTIVVTGQSGFWQLENPSLLLWSPEQQQADYPGDTGMDALHELEDLEVTWTRA